MNLSYYLGTIMRTITLPSQHCQGAFRACTSIALYTAKSLLGLNHENFSNLLIDEKICRDFFDMYITRGKELNEEISKTTNPGNHFGMFCRKGVGEVINSDAKQLAGLNRTADITIAILEENKSDFHPQSLQDFINAVKDSRERNESKAHVITCKNHTVVLVQRDQQICLFNSASTVWEAAFTIFDNADELYAFLLGKWQQQEKADVTTVGKVSSLDI